MNTVEKLQMNPVIAEKASISWDINGQQYENFTDLGEYVVMLGDYDKCDVEAVLAKIRDNTDVAQKAGCTGTVKRNKAGDVIMAHNMDLDVTQSPASVFTTSFGKYKTFNIYYIGNDPQTYEQLKADGKMDSALYDIIPFRSTDVMNEKGLYISANMRFGMDERLATPGTNPGKTRTDFLAAVQLMAMNCANVKEAVAYVKNELDLYSVNIPEIKAYGWNGGVMVGDAEGEFGIIEFGANTVNYLPYCNGHANYYRAPLLEKMDKMGMGYGRFALVQKYLDEPEDIDGMMKLMSKIYYTKCIVDVEYAHRDADGKVVFCDENGNESVDWRSEYAATVLLDDNGNPIENPTEADCAYDVALMTEYMLSFVKGDKESTERLRTEGKKMFDEYFKTGSDWVLNDDNFEVIQKTAINANASQDKVENVKKFRAGDEQPIRTASNCWLSSLATGANCKEKTIKVAFWEKEEKVCVTFKW